MSRFVAGTSLDDALRVVAELQASGFRTTVDVLGEGVTDPKEALSAADAYLRLVRALHEAHLEPNVSLKLTQFGLDLDRDLCRTSVERIAQEATRLGGFVRIDMEDESHVLPALALGLELSGKALATGVVVQSYLRASRGYVEQMVESQTPVRLCKGAYAEPANVAFALKSEVDASYVELSERLLMGGRYPAFAT